MVCRVGGEPLAVECGLRQTALPGVKLLFAGEETLRQAAPLQRCSMGLFMNLCGLGDQHVLNVLGRGSDEVHVLPAQFELDDVAVSLRDFQKELRWRRGGIPGGNRQSGDYLWDQAVRPRSRA